MSADLYGVVVTVLMLKLDYLFCYYVCAYISHILGLLQRQSRKRGKPTPPGEGGMTLSTASPKRRRVKQRFGIGQVVFLENDRRKASWLPAVVSTSLLTSLEKKHVQTFVCVC